MVARKSALLRPCVAEFFGTFCLTLAVLLTMGASLALSTPVAAALTLGLLVYLIGPVSGAHVNPAITLGLLGIGRIRSWTALCYIVSQCAGAVVALVLAFGALGANVIATPDVALMAVFAEAGGAFILAFGVASVALNRVAAGAAGLALGGALLVGILLASVASGAYLNPAVALAAGAASVASLLGPIVGAALGALFARWLHGAE